MRNLEAAEQDLERIKVIVDEIILVCEKENRQGMPRLKKLCSEFYGILMRYGAHIISHNFPKGMRRSHGGYAVGTFDAANCIDDPMRTAKFIIGCRDAVLSLKEKFPGKQLRMLDAGCGPFSVLGLAMATQFTSEELKIVAADYNASTLDCARRVIDALEVDDHYAGFVQADIAKGDLDSKGLEKFDLIVVEMMDGAIGREPQLAAMHALDRMKTPNGVMLPQKIDIDLRMSNNREDGFRVGRIAEISSWLAKATINQLGQFDERGVIVTDKTFSFSPPEETYPYDVPVERTFWLQTKVDVFEGRMVMPGDSYITRPRYEQTFVTPNRTRLGKVSVRVPFGVFDPDSKFRLTVHDNQGNIVFENPSLVERAARTIMRFSVPLQK